MERENGLAKHSTIQDNLLVQLWAPELPSLVVQWIADQQALNCMGGEGGTLVLLQVYIHKAAKWSQSRYIRFSAIEQLK